LYQEFPTLVPSEARAAEDDIGGAIAVDGNWAVIGDQFGNVAGQGSGAAYVYEKVAGQWVEQSQLLGGDTNASDSFGAAVAINGDTIVIGAPSKGAANGGETGNLGAGAVYVFTRRGLSWIQQAELVASTRTDFDLFGHGVAIDGDTMVISAAISSMAYVFERSQGVWTQTANPAQPDGIHNYIDSQVSVRGDAFVVPSFDASGYGVVYVFERSSGGWSASAKLTSPHGFGTGQFGRAVAISNDTLVVGEPYVQPGIPGSVLVYGRQGGQWRFVQEITGVVADSDDGFGRTIAIDGSTIVVGADQFSGTLNDIGHIYLYQKSADGLWGESSAAVGLGSKSRDFFGAAVAFDGTDRLCRKARSVTGS
jgi:hypothetical protein